MKPITRQAMIDIYIQFMQDTQNEIVPVNQASEIIDTDYSDQQFNSDQHFNDKLELDLNFDSYCGGWYVTGNTIQSESGDFVLR